MIIRSAKELIVYTKAYALAMELFEVTKRFPSEERYGLAGQMTIISVRLHEPP
jgi:hypothetical protein